MRQKILFATGNAGKMREIREILQDMDAEILSMVTECLLGAGLKRESKQTYRKTGLPLRRMR